MQNKQNFFVPLKERMSLMDYAYMLQKFGAFNAPRQFQRPIAWKSNDRKKFFQSMLMDRVEGTYVLVDVKSCIGRLELAGECNSDTYKFFKKFLSEGYKYVILDGNNRMCFIKSLFDDTFVIPEGKYEYITDDVNGSIASFTVRKGKQKFSDLPERVREVLMERQAAISLYTQITLEGMSEVFQNVNSGVPLNGQELRNAYSSPWAEYVRNIADDICALLAKLFIDHRSRLRGEEWIADCLDMNIQAIDHDPILNETKFTTVSQNTKNKLYKSNFLNENDESFYFDKFVELMDFITLMLQEEILDVKSLTRTSAVQNLYWMMCNGLDTYDQVVAAVEAHEIAYNDKNRTFTCGQDEKTFKECCNGLSNDNLTARHIVFKEIIEKVIGSNPNNLSTISEAFGA
jgi:hypothetical protein|tara:strand:+ start:132 stop:1337 length:1206 start_codon:yes stop_codon:yes gene_type:complete